MEATTEFAKTIRRPSPAMARRSPSGRLRGLRPRPHGVALRGDAVEVVDDSRQQPGQELLRYRGESPHVGQQPSPESIAPRPKGAGPPLDDPNLRDRVGDLGGQLVE